jgi:predicted transcriptional regulator
MSLKNNDHGLNSTEFKIDVDELANMIGTTRHYVIKLIGQLSKTGMIKARLDKMKILDFEKLFKEASGDYMRAV